MQKILFYQTRKPKTADGLWMHKDADGNMKLDYVSNGRVKPLGYMNSEAGGSASGGYKNYIKINPSAELWSAAANGLHFSTAAAAAQALGVSEEDFRKIYSDQFPNSLGTTAGISEFAAFVVNHEPYEDRESYEVGATVYKGKNPISQKNLNVGVRVMSDAESDDDVPVWLVAAFYDERN